MNYHTPLPPSSHLTLTELNARIDEERDEVAATAERLFTTDDPREALVCAKFLASMFSKCNCDLPGLVAWRYDGLAGFERRMRARLPIDPCVVQTLADLIDELRLRHIDEMPESEPLHTLALNLLRREVELRAGRLSARHRADATSLFNGTWGTLKRSQLRRWLMRVREASP